MTTADYDVLIIGGGPAGSCAAAFARQRQLRVLLVEKDAYPRFHVGESLLPAGNAVLREAGVWTKIEAAGFVPKYGAEFHTADGECTKRVDFSTSLIPGLDRTYQVDRARFDELLLKHAGETGAEVRLRTRAVATESTDLGHRVRLSGPAGESTVTTRWLLDATGRDQVFMTAQKRLLDPSPFPKRMAIYSHFTGVARASGRDAGNILIVRLEDGWFWLIPIDHERTSVGLVTTIESFRSEGRSPEAAFHAAVARSPKLRSLMNGATAVMGYHVTSDYTYFRSELATERTLLVGDAAGFLDPIFSSGVYMAISSAKLAVETLARADATGRSLTRHEQRRYTSTIKKHAAVFQKLIAAFYDADAFDVFLCQRIPWSISPGITSIVAGHARLTWPLWWRFHLFLLVCRLQRHWKVVKPEDLRPEPAAAGV